MTEFLIVFAGFAIAIVGLGIGTLFGKAPLRGSCGGNTVLKVCPLCKSEDTP